MTMLESYKRKKQLRVVCHLKKHIPRQENHDVTIKYPIDLDDTTASSIRMEIALLLQQTKKRPCTLMTIANLLFSNSRIKDHFAKAKKEKGKSNRHGGFLSWLRSPSTEKDETSRRYQYIGAVKKLEQTPGAASKIIQSWEEAVELLAVVFRFPDPVLNGDSQLTPKNDNLVEFQKRMNAIKLRDEKSIGCRPSQKIWHQVANAALSPKIISEHVEKLDKADQSMFNQLKKEYELAEKRRKEKEAIERLEKLQKEKEAKELAASLMRPLTVEEQSAIKKALYGSGSSSEIIAQLGTDSVSRATMATLRPGGWLSDEVIHYFLMVLSIRDEDMCRVDPTRKRCHFFKSFFVTKLLNEGHSDPRQDGKYDYKNVKRWSKKIPAKTIFQLDKIFFPINQGSMHWVMAVAFMQKRKIQFFDSMGSSGHRYLDALFRYIKDEYMSQNGCAMPDENDWELVACIEETPQQRNSTYPCGLVAMSSLPGTRIVKADHGSLVHFFFRLRLWGVCLHVCGFLIERLSFVV